MGLDIKIPIGFMFSIFGLLLTVWGFFSRHDAAMYERSMNINVNLWLGLGMLVFGLLMLLMARRTKKTKENK